MIAEPNTEKLRERIPDVYELITLVAQRAREIDLGSEKLTIYKHNNPLTLAAHEVSEGKVYNVGTHEEHDEIALEEELEHRASLKPKENK